MAVDYQQLVTKGRTEKFVQVGHYKDDHYDFEILMDGVVIGSAPGPDPNSAWKAVYEAQR